MGTQAADSRPCHILVVCQISVVFRGSLIVFISLMILEDQCAQEKSFKSETFCWPLVYSFCQFLPTLGDDDEKGRLFVGFISMFLFLS